MILCSRYAASCTCGEYRDPIIITLKATVIKTSSASFDEEKTKLAKTSVPSTRCLLVEDIAGYFFCNGHLIEKSVNSSAFFSSLPGLYSRVPAGSALSNIIPAVGLARFSKADKAPEVVSKASPKHAVVLRSIKAVIADPVEA